MADIPGKNFIDESRWRELVSQLIEEKQQERMINNPCGHTGYESKRCVKCGYPDPVKYVKILVQNIESYRESVLILKKEKEALIHRVNKLEYLLEQSQKGG